MVLLRTKAIREVELIMTGDSKKVSSQGRRILNFEGGSKMTIYSAILLDREGKVLGSSDMIGIEHLGTKSEPFVRRFSDFK